MLLYWIHQSTFSHFLLFPNNWSVPPGINSNEVANILILWSQPRWKGSVFLCYTVCSTAQISIMIKMQIYTSPWRVWLIFWYASMLLVENYFEIFRQLNQEFAIQICCGCTIKDTLGFQVTFIFSLRCFSVWLNESGSFVVMCNI